MGGEPPEPEETKQRPRRFRRILIIVIGLAIAFIVYAFAFERTDVSLDEIQSETRQEQLFRILRALVRPDLITYDTEELPIGVDVFVPCEGASTAPASSDVEGRTLTVTPGCAAPGETMTITGSGFEAGKEVRLQFVPVSDFDVVLPIERVEAGESGAFTTTFEAPERTSEEPQQVLAVTSVNVGSWFNRVPVWTDTNVNGVEDPNELPLSDAGLSASPLLMPTFSIRDPGGVALVDENANVLHFISWGGEFEATTGRAAGLTSTDIGADPFIDPTVESVQLTGPGENVEEFVWTGPAVSSWGELNAGQEAGPEASRSDLFINEVGFGEEAFLEITGPPGSSLDGMVAMFYDAENGGNYKTVTVTDTSDLSPRLSENAINTWNRIVETVMLALLATTVGTMLAIPLSFVAAKNLMRDIAVPVINLSLVILAVLVGLVLGPIVAGWARDVSEQISTLFGAVSTTGWLAALGIVVILALIRYGVRWTFPEVERDQTTLGIQAMRAVILVASGFGILVVAYLGGDVLIAVGETMGRVLPVMKFLGDFVATLGEILGVMVALIAAFLAAGGLAIAAGKLGYFLRAHLKTGAVNLITFVAAGIAGFALGGAIGIVIAWFGNFDDSRNAILIPALLGALIGILLAARAMRRASQNVGLVVYYNARTLFNGTRSIEPLVMVIIFVVWVGIGPFAGALALALHTTAALAKLYSEQVESIDTGPLEAVRATGATRMQTVVYAVVPQIVAPYISFTMYRWDINVRMSTIIGFAGGGGIGFLLQQNINLLQYRAAAAQMLAIAIVVATMDYISSRLRERFV
jgi:phosphonate ABC transporter permease subunit PhnE